MSLIEYYPGESFMHKLDPRVKVISLLIVTIAIFIVTNFVVIGVTFLTCILLWANSKLPLQKIKGYLKFLMSLFVILTLMQAFFYSGEHYLVKPVIPEFIPLIGGLGSISQEGVLFGLLLSFRLLTLVCFMPLIMMTTPIHLFSLGLVKMGMSYKIAYMATTAINLIPIFESETQVIMDAQKMRGLKVFEKGKLFEKFKAYPALVVPLVIGAMRKAQLMGVAMDSRAFGASPQRTYIEDITMRPVDLAALLFTIIYAGVAVWANFVL